MKKVMRRKDPLMPCISGGSKRKVMTHMTRKVTNQDRVVVNCTRSRVKTKPKLTNLMKISRIEGYNGK